MFIYSDLLSLFLASTGFCLLWPWVRTCKEIRPPQNRRPMWNLFPAGLPPVTSRQCESEHLPLQCHLAPASQDAVAAASTFHNVLTSSYIKRQHCTRGVLVLVCVCEDVSGSSDSVFIWFSLDRSVVTLDISYTSRCSLKQKGSCKTRSLLVLQLAMASQSGTGCQGIECHHIETEIDFGLKAALPETLKHKISSGDAWMGQNTSPRDFLVILSTLW